MSAHAGFNHGVDRVNDAEAVHQERIRIQVGFERADRQAPDALGILLEGRGLLPQFSAQADLARVGSAQPEGHRAVRAHLG